MKMFEEDLKRLIRSDERVSMLDLNRAVGIGIWLNFGFKFVESRYNTGLGSNPHFKHFGSLDKAYNGICKGIDTCWCKRCVEIVRGRPVEDTTRRRRFVFDKPRFKKEFKTKTDLYLDDPISISATVPLYGDGIFSIDNMRAMLGIAPLGEGAAFYSRPVNPLIPEGGIDRRILLNQAGGTTIAYDVIYD